ncbi:uncharacterized protein LOC128206056 [Mya arenaria]|uniref:uncharacterized protein LOC128206056 n=1 Tax=Mya arenaria TaxID=6604 RepID=UPI0022E43ED7|nr:uncharacterized protein LOC128206056 [Mya arenaria]
MWLHDNGTPNDVSDDVVIPENNNETITHKDNTIATKSNVTFKAVAAHIGTSVYCKATNNNVNWLYSKFILITVLLPSSSVEITQPRTASVTAYEKEKCLFECVTSPGLPASTITWYKITNGSEVVLIANGSSITKLNNKTIVSRSWLSLAFSIAEDWTYVYCTANNSVRTLTSRRQVAIHVHKHARITERNDDSTLAKAAIGLSSVIGTSFVFLIVGYCMIKKIRSLKANPQENGQNSGYANRAHDKKNDNNGTESKAIAESSYTTLKVYENTMPSEVYEPIQATEAS